MVLADLSKHSNKTYNIISDRYTYNDLTAAFSEVLGREIKYVRVPYETTKQAIQANLQKLQVDGLLQLFKLIDDGAASMKDQEMSSFTDITNQLTSRHGSTRMLMSSSDVKTIKMPRSTIYTHTSRECHNYFCGFSHSDAN